MDQGQELIEIVQKVEKMTPEQFRRFIELVPVDVLELIMDDKI